MTYYDGVYEDASDNFGFVAVSRARELGISKDEIAKLHARGKLSRIGYGVYRIKHHVPSALDVYADAVALVGPGSYVLGESVLAMHELASVNPEAIKGATTRRMRRNLPTYVEAVRRLPGDRSVSHDGIPSMTVSQAIRVCSGEVMPERLEEAVVDAYCKGLVPKDESEALKKELT